MLQLRGITRNNFMQVTRLQVTDAQKSFVAPNVYSLAEAKADPACVPLAVYDDELLVGFVMYTMDEQDQEYWIYRLMIDRQYQRRGYGRAALLLALERIKADQSHHVVYISFEPENEAARDLYTSIGFTDDHRIEEGEVIYGLRY